MTPEQKLLLRAADLLAERGWTQGELVDSAGRLCAVGAIKCAAGEDRAMFTGATLRLAEALTARAHRPDPFENGCTIADWNDVPDRTAEDVILAMKRAAHDQ